MEILWKKKHETKEKALKLHGSGDRFVIKSWHVTEEPDPNCLEHWPQQLNYRKKYHSIKEEWGKVAYTYNEIQLHFVQENWYKWKQSY